jgi:hypothetical protein
MTKFKIDPPYGTQSEAQTGYDTQVAGYTQKGFKFGDATIKDQTISGTGTRTIDVEAPKAVSGGTPGTPWENKMRSLLGGGVSYKKLAEMGHGYEAALKKKFPGAYKPKTETQDVKTQWTPKPVEVEEPPEKKEVVDNGGDEKVTDGSIKDTDATNTEENPDPIADNDLNQIAAALGAAKAPPPSKNAKLPPVPKSSMVKGSDTRYPQTDLNLVDVTHVV